MYTAAVVALLLSLFWRPHVGLYFIIPLIPLQTLRYRIGDFPLGNKLVDIMLLGVLLGSFFKNGFQITKTPLNKLLLLFAIFCYVQLWRGSFYLNTSMPLSLDDPRFSNWKNYMVLFILFAVVVNVVKDVKQMKIIVLLICLSILAVDKGFYSTISDRDLTHFSYDVREGGPLGYAGVNGLACFAAESMLFLLGLVAFEARKYAKIALWLLVAFSAYCVLFSFSREAYAGVLFGLVILGLLQKRWVLVALAFFLFSWQTLVPTSVRERVLMTYDAQDKALDSSAQERVEIWDDAMALFEQNPVLGNGFDTYEWQHRVGQFRDTHNYYLKVVVETGIVGLMFFLLLLAQTTRIGWKLYRSAQDPFFRSLGLGFLLFLACVWVVNFFGDRWLFLQVDGFFWVILALVVRAQIMVDAAAKQETTATAGAAETVPGGEELAIA
jgi:O-antigen ligase